MKRLSVAKTKNGDLCSQINADHFSDLSQVEQANFVNWAFHEPLLEYVATSAWKSLCREYSMSFCRNRWKDATKSQPH